MKLNNKSVKSLIKKFYLFTFLNLICKNLLKLFLLIAS